MLDWDIVWRGLLLSVVFLADVVVFVGLAKDELRHFRSRLAIKRRRAPARELHPQPLSLS